LPIKLMASGDLKFLNTDLPNPSNNIKWTPIP